MGTRRPTGTPVASGVEPGQLPAADGLADSLVAVLSDRALAERLGAAAAADAPSWASTPEEFAVRVADLVRLARA